MRPAVEVLDGVGEAEDALAVALVPLQRDLHSFSVPFVVDEDRLVVEGSLGLVDVLDEGDDAAFVAVLVLLLRALVADLDQHAAVEKGELAQPL